jgi:ABC-type sugar transport system ATPase subunit
MTVSSSLEVEIGQVIIGDLTVLESVSFKCEPGTITLLVGENGSGKSILLKSIAGVQPGVHGRIQTNGVEHKFAGKVLGTSGALWPHLTMVLQSYALWPTMSIGEQIRLSPSLRGEPITSERFDALVDSFGLGEFIHRRPSALSGGERQRSALAKAFALEPEVILLDEPSSSDKRKT